MNERILLIRTGGTIDAEAYEDPHNPPSFVKTLYGEKSLVMRMARKLFQWRKSGDVDELSWGRWEVGFVKDSQKFTHQDIQALARVIKHDDHKYVIITHGTDQMIPNAEELKRELGNTDKVIIFAGAMVPLSMHKRHRSDFIPTLGFIHANIRHQPPGVYVTGYSSYTGRLAFSDPQQVEKDRLTSLNKLKFTLVPRGHAPRTR